MLQLVLPMAPFQNASPSPTCAKCSCRWCQKTYSAWEGCSLLSEGCLLVSVGCGNFGSLSRAYRFHLSFTKRNTEPCCDVQANWKNLSRKHIILLFHDATPLKNNISCWSRWDFAAITISLVGAGGGQPQGLFFFALQFAGGSTF